MLYSLYILKDRRNRLRTAIKGVKDEQTDISIEKGRLNGFIYDIKLAIKEYQYKTESYDLSSYEEITSKALINLKNTSNGAELKEAVEALADTLDRIDIDRLEAYANYGNYYYINTNIIMNITNCINNRGRNFTVFDSACRDGYLLQEIKNINDKADLYGLEENNNLAEKAKEHLTRLIKGTLRGSKISNEVFDMVIDIPKIDATLEGNMFSAAVSKKEKNSIMANLKYLRPDGIMFIALPFYRMHKDICVLLAKQLKNVVAVKGIGSDETFGIVYIIGQKKSEKELDDSIYENLRKCYNYSNVSSLGEIELPNYILPNKYENIDLFKGSIIDKDEILNISQNSNCLNSFFEKQKVKKINDNIIEPLLPFNIGQIGLVLTSGCLDGIIDEGDGHYHLVKGRVSKKVDTERSVSDGIVEQTEVISNKVEINVLLPNGDYKTLA